MAGRREDRAGTGVCGREHGPGMGPPHERDEWLRWGLGAHCVERGLQSDPLAGTRHTLHSSTQEATARVSVAVARKRRPFSDINLE